MGDEKRVCSRCGGEVAAGETHHALPEGASKLCAVVFDFMPVGPKREPEPQTWSLAGRLTVQKLELRPGDILVLHLEHPILGDELASFRKQVRAYVGFPVQVLALSGDESVEVLTPITDPGIAQPLEVHPVFDSQGKHIGYRREALPALQSPAKPSGGG